MKRLGTLPYLYVSKTYSFSDVGDESLIGEFDYQLHLVLYDKNQKKIGDAAFCYLKNSDEMWFCDYFDLGIEINKEHRNKGIGTEILTLAKKITKRKLVLSPNHHESSPEGKRLVQRFL